MWIIAQLLAPEIEVVFGGEDYDIALLGGGTLINQSPWLIDHFGGILQKAPLGGVVFGSGVGDTAFWGDHLAAWKAILEGCADVGVRGPASLRLLRECGCQHAEVIGDPYLALQTPLQVSPGEKLIGINVGLTNDSLWGGDDRDYFEFVAAALERLKQRGWSFLFVSVWSRDLPVVAGLRDHLGGDQYPLLDARTDSLECLARLSSCQLFLGEKLHACAMAAVAEVPFIALEYQPKVRDFAESLDMGDYTISTAEREPQDLLRRIESLHRSREETREHLRRALALNRERIHAFSRRVKDRFSFPADPSGGTP